MKISKIKKKNSKEYILTGDDESLVLYDETILKYNILITKNIDNKDKTEILKYNDALKAYYKQLKSLGHKRKTEKEVFNLLIKDGIDSKTAEEFIAKFKDMRLINDNAFLDAYIHDAINIKKIGPRKIETDLLQKGFGLTMVRERLAFVANNTWLEIIDKYIEKRIKANRTDSALMLKVKTASFIVHQGFSKEMVMSEVNKYDFSNVEVAKKAYDKQKRLLSKKYSGEELQNMVKNRLLAKGFEIEEIDKIL